MIFDELILENFGPYKGTHAITLAPDSPEKPIVLIGGLNGGGKTSLVDAIQLALYGRLANCSNRADLSYEQFLANCINRNVAPEEGSSVQLRFRHRQLSQVSSQRVEPVECEYLVRRAWSKTGSAIKERLEVFKDGQTDSVLTESWQEYVEEFFPLKIANLFFFDGEKIESLADPEQCVQTLQTAIQSLLGLDVIDRLATDLIVLERRKQADMKSLEQKKQIEALTKKVAQCNREIDALVLKQGQQRNDIGQKEKSVKELERRFEAEGGKLYARCNELETKKAVATDNLSDLEEELRELAGGVAPLLCLSTLVTELARQDELEEGSHENIVLGQVLEQRDAHVLKRAKSEGFSAELVKRLSKILADDRICRADEVETARYLNLSDSARQFIAKFDLTEDSTFKLISRQLGKAEELAKTLSDIERKLASIPDAESIAELANKRDKALVALEQSRLKLEAQELELERLKKDHSSCVNKLEAALRVDLDKEDDQRVLSHSQKVRSTLAKFRESLLDKHARRLETLIFDSLSQLLRKQQLVSAIEMHANPLSLKLIAGDGQFLDSNRLSAGERQLLATAILWGLARAVGKPLPTIIDTPLGRLDSAHRSHLVERYFPNASHQVILLSTDEEINDDYFEQIQPWVGRSYTLAFNEAEAATTISPGYLSTTYGN